MNPCAPTFIPVEPSEDECSSDEDESTPSSMEARHPDQDVRSPRARPRGRTIPTIAIDPDAYESMFPALRTTSQIDPLKIRSSKMKKKERSNRQIPMSQGDQVRYPSTVNDERLSEGHHSSQSSIDEEEEEDSDETPLEYLKPTVYTPSKSVELLKPDVYTPPASSRNSIKRPGTKGSMRLLDARARTRSPRRAWRPPTPHPDGRPRGSRSRRAPPPPPPPPGPRVMSPVGYPVPLVYRSPFGHYASIPSHPMTHYPINYASRLGPSMAPPMMPYSPLPWSITPAPWIIPLAQPEMMMDYPSDRDSSPKHEGWPSFERESGMYHASLPPPPVLPPQPYIYPHTEPPMGLHRQSEMNLQPPPRSEPYPPAQGSDSPWFSRSQSTESRHEKNSSTSGTSNASNSSSTAATNGSSTATPSIIQADMIKNQSGGAQLGSKHNNAVCSDDSTQEEVKKELRIAAEYSKTTGFIPTRQAQSSQDSSSVVRGAKINIKRETAPPEQKKAQERSQKPVDLLQSAPKGPSSARQLPQMFSATLKQSRNLIGPESGSWSQSKRWTSFATKERQAFQKMMANLHYMSADQSPFVPQSPVELTAFKANLAESKTRKLDQEVKQRLAKTNACIDEGVENKVKPMVKLLRGKKFEDRLSPVFAASNCFNRSRIKPPYAAEWPTLAELKEEGDKRSSRQGRCLPLPRLDIIAFRFSSGISEACNADGAIRSDKKVIQVGSRYLCPVTPEEHSITPPVELESDEAPLGLGALLRYIDAADDEAKTTAEDTENTDGQEEQETAETRSRLKRGDIQNSIRERM
ncbi:40s ribosomal s8 [Fusarium beomiforme]|uniref:40s ribosomal s8 n=1 Tax=Fusarium beomiforme TaxID=44412 RepID=A0A9P5E2J5_9HYPO|nr:40s ribosomal s8 [Fusarium beomiforme]